MNAMASVCDWRGRSCYMDGYGVDEQGNLLPPTSTEHTLRPGLMHKMIDMCERQLDLGYTENVHAMSATRGLGEWLRAVEVAFGRPLREHERSLWSTMINQFYKPLDRTARHVNEGGFVVRLLDWLQPRLQRRWYIKLYGRLLGSDQELTVDANAYQDDFIRPSLPRTMSPPVVPSLLPFNTVSKRAALVWHLLKVPAVHLPPLCSSHSVNFSQKCSACLLHCTLSTLVTRACLSPATST